MILDSLNNAAHYYGLSPRLQQAFEWIAKTDWMSLTSGTHELDGRNLFANVMDVDLKRKPDAKLEIHDRYLDIQVLISGEEEAFGWSERRALKQPLGAFDTAKDIQFFDDAPQTWYTVRPGQFTLLMPDDAHAPMVGTGRVRKIIVKVLR